MVSNSMHLFFSFFNSDKTDMVWSNMQTCNLEEIFSMQWIASGGTPGIFQEYVLPLRLGWALVKNLRGVLHLFLFSVLLH